MEIVIIQKKFTFIHDKFEIFINKTLTYKARSFLFSLTRKIKVTDLNNNELFRIEKELNFADTNFPNYSLILSTNSVIRFLTESFIEYRLHTSKGVIQIYEQKGRKMGLFLNNNQIGVIDKNKNVFFGGDRYEILIDSEEIEKELAIAFTLAYDNYFHNNHDSIIDTDFGNVNINPEKVIDLNWKPKK